MTMQIKFQINGVMRQVDVAANTTLVEALRDDLDLTGTKEGCGVGECGTCVVVVDGEPVTSCLMLAADAAGKHVETVEGLAVHGELTRLQQAFVAMGAFQCGFCTPGMVMCATALLRRSPDPDVAEIKDALGGVLCRCGAYPKIIDAIRSVAGEGL
jgi:carbon-monoxide dehydrogenase small subunit